jgi:hypothetical protein
MKVGSLVKCVKKIEIHPENVKDIVWLPEVGGTYTVRDIGGKLIVLEEGVVGFDITRGGIEYGMATKNFREIQPPMDLTELLNECIKTPHYATNI